MISGKYWPVNFSISSSASIEIARLRRIWDETSLDRADVLMVGWGITHFNTGEKSSGVVISFYSQSERYEIQNAIQILSGREVVFFITEEYHSRFKGKTVDFLAEKGFFLRA